MLLSFFDSCISGLFLDFVSDKLLVRARTPTSLLLPLSTVDMGPYSILAILSAALLWAAQVAATTFPATVEVDLIFPRNDTYPPSALFPIVFAFQNAALAPSLDPGFDMTLWDSNGNGASVLDPSIDLKWTNFSSSEPTYVYTYVTSLNTTNGTTAASYRLNWAFGAGNCSNEGGAQTIGGGFRDNGVVFTIQSGAQQPDLIAASTTSCANMSHFAFNLTGTLDVTQPDKYDGRNSCAVFSDVHPLVDGNPCAAQVGSVAASSISAALTATACAAATPVISCPSDNAATRRWKDGYTASLGALFTVFIAMQFL